MIKKLAVLLIILLAHLVTPSFADAWCTLFGDIRPGTFSCRSYQKCVSPFIGSPFGQWITLMCDSGLLYDSRVNKCIDSNLSDCVPDFWRGIPWGSAPGPDNGPAGPWLSGISGAKPIGSISLPGTHDSASNIKDISGFVQNQVLTIPEQLTAGIRFLDIRCRHFNNNFAIHHGSYYLKINFDDVLKYVTQFLKANPTETVLMRVKEEHKPDGNSQTFQEKFHDYFSKETYAGFFWQYNNNINPSLDEVRGKILVIQDFSGPVRYGPLFSEFIVQDNYNPKNPDRISKKKESILQNFNLAQQHGMRMLISHLSAYSAQLPFLTPRSMSKSINPFMYDLIMKEKPNYVGIIPADFPESSLIYAVIRTNEEFQRFQTRTSFRQHTRYNKTSGL